MSAFFVGAAFAFGVIVLVAGVRATRPSVAAVFVDVLNPTVAPDGPVSHRTTGFLRQIDEKYGVRFASMLGVDNARQSDELRHDLRVTAMTAEEFAVDKVVLSGFGIVLPFMVCLTLGSLGVALPLIAVLGVSSIFGLVGFVMPNLLLRSEAERYRRDFRHGLASLLELVSVSMAGGAQVQHALADAVRDGRPASSENLLTRESGWVFEELGRPIDRAVRERQAPWQHLSQLGRELGIPELSELTSSMTAAGAEGADVRASLVSRAQSLRARRIAEAEGEASEIGQRMSFPIALLAFGFLMFVGYPAVERVLQGL